MLQVVLKTRFYHMIWLLISDTLDLI